MSGGKVSGGKVSGVKCRGVKCRTSKMSDMNFNRSPVVAVGCGWKK